MYRKSVLGIGLTMGLLLTASSLAVAQSAARTDPMLNNGPPLWDANHDGVYTCDEWKSFMDRLFKSADRNHDGSLSPSEFEAIKKADPTLAEADFGYIDGENRTAKSRAERVRRDKPSAFILRFDRNGDCRVTPDKDKSGRQRRGRSRTGSARAAAGPVSLMPWSPRCANWRHGDAEPFAAANSGERCRHDRVRRVPVGQRKCPVGPIQPPDRREMMSGIHARCADQSCSMSMGSRWRSAAVGGIRGRRCRNEARRGCSPTRPGTPWCEMP